MDETFEPSNPDYRAAVENIFGRAGFIQMLGIELSAVGPGWCESELTLEPRHLQQDGFAHAGLVATIADHTAGAAAGSLLSANATVLTVEYKINLLRPGLGESLFSRAEVIRNGKRIIVAESSVYGVTGSARKLIAKGIFTLAVLPK
ncbi:MAG: PaaI family thioesterase [Candidatus Hydrogenedentes bacterium]|nr:PaaI family thioesterase [Candidatus Hydrogenedentota bacterium]